MSFSEFVWPVSNALLIAVLATVWWRDRKFSESVIRDLRDELKRTSDDSAASLAELRAAHARELLQVEENGVRAGESAVIRSHAQEISSLRKEQQAEIEKILSGFRDQLDCQRREFLREKDAEIRAAHESKRLEYEGRMQAFSVQVSPFVRTRDNKGILTNKLEIESGLAYQLLIQGLPAFDPHETVTKSDVHEVRAEHVDKLISAAIETATLHVSGMVGAAGGLVKMGEPIRRLLK